MIMSASLTVVVGCADCEPLQQQSHTLDLNRSALIVSVLSEAVR
jgi:hypothetical protein